MFVLLILTSKLKLSFRNECGTLQTRHPLHNVYFSAFLCLNMTTPPLIRNQAITSRFGA